MDCLESYLTTSVISPQTYSPDFTLLAFVPADTGYGPITQENVGNIFPFLSFFSVWQKVTKYLDSSYSFILLVELVVDLDGLGDQAEKVEVLHVAGGVVQHPGLAVVVAVVGVAAVVSRRENLKHYDWPCLQTSAGGWWRWSRGRDRPRLQQPRWSRRRPEEWC